MKSVIRTFPIIPAVLLLCMGTASAIAEEDEMEEVVVTGSYIKRDSFDSASPLTVIDQVDISAQATPALGEILANQTYNYGSDFVSNTYAARSQEGNATSANLRGLGTGATLNLIDGRRSADSNLNRLMPQIAISRIDILKDGAAALYGTDAVAGVVNIITRKNFSGAEVSYFYTQDGEDDFYENSVEFISGTDTDNGHITVAASYRRKTTLEQTERPIFLTEGFERSGTGNPGDWLVPVRDATGAIVSSARMTDPGCGVDNGSGTDVGVKNNWRSGDKSGSNCRLHFGEFWNFVNPNEVWTLWANYQYEFTDNFTNEIDILGSRQITDSRGSPQNPGGRTEEFPIVLGTHPGNPYRAMADRGAGLEPLFARDANGDGVPDRGAADLNGDGVMDVLLAADPFDSASGIAFNEDVDVVALRIFGKLGLKPISFFRDGANTGNASWDSTTFKIVDQINYSFPDSSWELSAYGLYQKLELVLEGKNTSQTALVAGLQGNLRPSPTADPNQYWNPFSTQELTCTNRVCTTGVADFANNRDVIEAINIQDNDVTNWDFWVVEAVATGDLMELPAGTLAAAFGLQYRKVIQDADLSASKNECDWHEGGCEFDWRAKQDVQAVFFELAVPVLDGGAGGKLEVQLAGRYSDYGSGVDSLDPKIAALWQPIDILSFRASFSEAFKIATLTELHSPEICGLQTANDPLTQDLSQSFRVACAAGNPNLDPETADVWNVGVSLSLLDGDLNLGVDYAEYDFEDRIALTTMNQVLTRDFNNFLAAGGDVDDQDGSVQDWINGPNSDPAIFRDVTGVVTRVLTSRLNAQKMLHKAWDIYASYNLNLDNWGDFRFNVGATFVDEFSYDLGLGIPAADGAGSQNESVSEIPPMPEWRVNGTINWALGNHGVMVRVRWIDGFELAFNSAGLMGGQLFFNNTNEMDSITYTDLSYSYRFDNLFGDRVTRLEIGGRNVFDEFPDPIFNLGGIETFVHDVRGRMWYFRLNQDI